MKNTIFSPVIKWSGSKRSQADEIIARFPKRIKTYYEPFLGGGSIMRAVMQSDVQVDRFVCSDKNSDLINLWQHIKDYPDELADRYEELWKGLNDKDDDKSRKIAYYNSIRKRFNEDRSPADFLFLLRTCANGMPRYNSSGEFNTSFHITRDGIHPETLRTVIREWSSLLNSKNVSFQACSYDTIHTEPDDFLYLDPPYAGTKGMYYGAIDNEAFFHWLDSQEADYALSFDGKCKDMDYTYDVPEHLYDNHIYLRSGNSSFRRVTGNSRDSVVYESLYVKSQKKKEMKDKFVYDPHYLSGEKETWTLGFEHYKYQSQEKWDASSRTWKSHERIGIRFTADKPGRTPAFNTHIVIGTASYQLGQSPEKIILRTQDAEGEFVRQLIDQKFAKYISEGVERQQDYPGAEIDEFPWTKIDVTDFYNQYLAQHQQHMKDSPISDIVLCEKSYNPYYIGKKDDTYMKCRIGGIEQERRWSGVDGRNLRELADACPEYKFHLVELAEDIFKNELLAYKQAKERVSDARIINSGNTSYLRCKVDGEQLSAKKISPIDACHYNNTKDIYALAAKYFGDAFGQEQEKTLSRGR